MGNKSPSAKLEVSKWWEQVVPNHTRQGEGLTYDTDLIDHFSCLSDGWNYIFFLELQWPGIKEANSCLSDPNSHRNALFRSKKEVIQPALLTALLTDSQLLISITRRPLCPRGKRRSLFSPPPLRTHETPPGSWSQPLPSVSTDEKAHPGVCRKPNLPCHWNLAKQTLGESCQNLQPLPVPWPRLVLNLPIEPTFTPSCWSLTWICHNFESYILIHWNTCIRKEEREKLKASPISPKPSVNGPHRKINI